MREVKWLQKMLREVGFGEEVSGKKGSLHISLANDGEFKMFHYGTLILHMNVRERKVYSCGGAYSQTDARYINNALYYFNMSRLYNARIKNYALEVVNLESGVVVK